MPRLQYYGFSELLTSLTGYRMAKKANANVSNELAMVASKLGAPSLSSNQYNGFNRIFVMLRP